MLTNAAIAGATASPSRLQHDNTSKLRRICRIDALNRLPTRAASNSSRTKCSGNLQQRYPDMEKGATMRALLKSFPIEPYYTLKAAPISAFV
jgi:hypothetical protein